MQNSAVGVKKLYEKKKETVGEEGQEKKYISDNVS